MICSLFCEWQWKLTLKIVTPNAFTTSHFWAPTVDQVLGWHREEWGSAYTQDQVPARVDLPALRSLRLCALGHCWLVSGDDSMHREPLLKGTLLGLLQKIQSTAWDLTYFLEEGIYVSHILKVKQKSLPFLAPFKNNDTVNSFPEL